MSLLYNPVLAARLIIIPFAFLQWGIVLWFLSRLKLHSKNFDKKLVSFIIYIFGIFGTVLAQRIIFGWITSASLGHSTDKFENLIITGEIFVSIFLFFYLLIKRQLNNRKT
jgi:hypothetical protein